MSYNGRRFENKIALVTGGNSGIGLAAAERFAAEGAQVIITGRDEKTLQEAAEKIGSHATAFTADVTKTTDLDRLFAQIKDKFGRLDVVFANAGIAKFLPLENVTEENFDAVVDTNFKGVFFTVQRAAPLLTRGGAIVLNGSISGSKGRPATSVYAATKAAVRSLARTLAAEFVERGVRVNVVSPGPITTPALNRIEGLPPEYVPGFVEQVSAEIPLKRFGTPEEVAAAVAFLASDEASYIVGAELFVDGGGAEL